MAVDLILIDTSPPRLPCTCGSSGRARSIVFSAYSKQHEFRHIAEIKADAPAVGAAILPHLVPNDVAFVFKTPSPHYIEASL